MIRRIIAYPFLIIMMILLILEAIIGGICSAIRSKEHFDMFVGEWKVRKEYFEQFEEINGKLVKKEI